MDLTEHNKMVNKKLADLVSLRQAIRAEPSHGEKILLYEQLINSLVDYYENCLNLADMLISVYEDDSCNVSN